MGDAAVVTAETDVGYEDVAPASGESAAAAQGGAAHTVGDAAVLAETDSESTDSDSSLIPTRLPLVPPLLKTLNLKQFMRSL